MFPQRKASSLCFEVPARGFECCLRHAMTAHRSHQRERIRGAFKLLPKDHWRQKFVQRGPAGVGPFIAVERSFAGGALAPSLGAVTVNHTGQNNASFSGSTEAGFEEMYEGQAYFAQFDRLDDQGVKMAPP